MCLAIPVRICQLLENDEALADAGGIEKTISLALLEDIKVGDYVMVHTGYALSKLDTMEAEKTLQLFSEMSSMKQKP